MWRRKLSCVNTASNATARERRGGRVCVSREKGKGRHRIIEKEKAQQFSIKFMSTKIPAFKIFSPLTASILFRDLKEKNRNLFRQQEQYFL
jgi:hypothetical protein